MDEVVKDLLINWKLERFIERFKEAGINEEILRDMNDDMLGDLFKKVECGFKQKFMKRLQEWKSDTPSHPPPSIKPTVNQSNPPSPSHFTIFIDMVETTKQSVLELLSSTTRGLIALAAFRLEQELNTRLISDVIIENEFETTKCYSITKERFLELANELGVIFASAERDKEKTSKLFYSPFVKATQSKKCVNTGGVLYEKYLSLRQKLIKYHIISKVISSPDDTPLSEHHQDIEWLRNNDEPENDVIQKWKDTFQHRDRCRDIKTYFAFYKCLCSPYGHILLAIDFALIYPKESNNFISNWPTAASKIITYAKDKHKVTPYETQLIDAGKKDIAALFCLANLLGIIIRKRKSCEAIFGNSIQDVKDSIIVNVKSHEDLEQYLVRRKSLSADKSGNVGSFVAVIGDINTVGDSEDKKTEVFLVINQLHFKIPSCNVIQAVDYCYKSFFALNTEFACECKHIWYFLQLYVYRNSVDNAKQYIIVNKLIDEFNKIN